MTKIDPYVHAALVLHGTGKPVTKDAISAIIKAAGGSVDEAKAKVLEEAVKGVNIDELASAPVAVAAAAPAAAEAPKADAKKDEKKEEASVSEGLSSLFG